MKEVAELVGISVRTLHHYNEIGLLVPDEITESGYRKYSANNLETLQQILFFKELGFPLKQIKEIINRPTFDRLEALEMQRKMLLEKQKRLDEMLKTIDKTIKHVKGEIEMSHQEKFKGFDFRNNPYEQEARERWGDQAVDEANKKVAGITKEVEKELAEFWTKAASIRHTSPESKMAQDLIGEWYTLLNQNFGTYSLEAFKGLGQMYIDDDRFTKNINQYGEGLAQFLCKAMGIYAEQNHQ